MDNMITDDIVKKNRAQKIHLVLIIWTIDFGGRVNKIFFNLHFS